MESNIIRARSTWLRTSGCEFPKVIQTRITKEDIFIKPELDEVYAKEDGAILLKCPSKDEACELQISVFPRYKIEALTILCTADKLEIFLGPLNEYIETRYGIEILDENEEESIDATIPLRRYDIEVQKSGVIELTLKLLPSADEVCIFGILLQIAPNPNGITTLLPTDISLDNVHRMLEESKQKLSPGAEKCKMFMEVFGKKPWQKNNESAENVTNPATQKHTNDPDFSIELENSLKAHIDMRLHELEDRLNKRLDDVMAKLSNKCP